MLEKIQAKTIFCATDLWIIAKLDNVIKKATAFFINFEYCDAREIIEQFFWRDFCDTYLEIIKTRIYNDSNTDQAGQLSAALTLHYILQTILKLFSPFIPYATEEIYLEILKNRTSVHARFGWPKSLLLDLDKYLVWNDVIFDILEQVRKEKTQKQLSIKSSIELLQISGIKTPVPNDLKQDLQNVTCAKQLDIKDIFDQEDSQKNNVGNNKVKIKIIL